MKLTCEKLCVEHVDGFIFPWVLTLQVNCMQGVLNEGGENHGHENCILKEKYVRQ